MMVESIFLEEMRKFGQKYGWFGSDHSRHIVLRQRLILRVYVRCSLLGYNYRTIKRQLKSIPEAQHFTGPFVCFLGLNSYDIKRRDLMIKRLKK